MLLMLYFNLIISVIVLTNAFKDPREPIVAIKNGLIRGKSHGHYYSFEGIPYAESPTGENRFEPPIPYLRSWSDVADATKLHESCIRLDPMEKRNITSPSVIVGSEDCLYLNIYTPDIESYKQYPVLFYIHGGGFMFGSGDDLRENILMERQNMILVTFNYRLGPFGFLSTGDDEIPGNMGLKDQRLALKWVKENIRAFNGNPSEILLSGFSAGAASVELHLLQPSISYYANAAISFSGSALCPWVIVKEPLKDALKMADIFKCRKSVNEVITSKQIKECLKDVIAGNIVETIHQYQSFLYNPFRIFGPVIEPKSFKGAFLTDHPDILIKNGVRKTVPWLATFTAQDGNLMLPDLMKIGEEGRKNKEEFNKDPKKILSIIYLYKFVQFGVDVLLKDKLYENLKLNGEFSHAPTYGYIYDNPAEYGWGHFISGNMNINFGTNHGDDVFLILDYPPRDLKKYPFREDEKENSNKFVKMLENYARTGIPQFGNFTFEPIHPSNHKIARITGNGISLEEF